MDIKTFANRVYYFLTVKIWQWDSTDNLQKTLLDRCYYCLKTLLLTARIFIQKDMWARDVAALTFASLMALIPFMAMLFVIARGFGYVSLLESWLTTTFEAQPVVATSIMGFVNNYMQNTQNSYIVGAGIAVMLYSIISLMQKIEKTFDYIWKTEERTWMEMLKEYPVYAFSFGLMIISSSSINFITVRIVENVGKYAAIDDSVSSFMLHMASFVPMCLFFIFVYIAIPHTYVRKRSVIVPALAAGVCMSMLQYGYMYAQMFLSSYNVIYGSLAALPLFLLWLQISWAICIFGTILCYVNQNLHHYAKDISYEELGLSCRLRVCTIIMHMICSNFDKGDTALTAAEIHNKTHLPQQIINSAIQELLKAGLIVEILSRKNGVKEEQTRLHPIEKISNLSYGKIIKKINDAGKTLDSSNNTDGEGNEEHNTYTDFKAIDEIESLNMQYLETANGIDIIKE